MTDMTLEHSPRQDACTYQVFENATLVPEAWREEMRALRDASQAGDGITPATAPPTAVEEIRFRVFNPTLAAVPGGFAMCYRVVADNTELRRLATCLLSEDLSLVPGSVTPLSDLIGFADESLDDERARTWHADPRYLRLQGQLHVIWNDGANRPMNHQFIMPLDERGLAPTGPAREITRTDRRDPIEKNWMLFEAEGDMWATYAIQPHEILKVNFDGQPRIESALAFTSKWQTGYTDFYGELRGSAQPVRNGDGFLVIAHSSYKTPAGRRYCASFYRHEAVAPFKVTAASTTPFDLPNPKGTVFDMPKLNKEVAEVVYPCGFVVAGDHAVVSYGLNDEGCAVARIALADIEREMSPVRQDAVVRRETSAQDLPADPSLSATPFPIATLPLFWWDAAGKKFDGGLGRRLFETGNFGDIASKEIVERVLQSRTRAPRKGERKLLSIGSVLHTAGDGDVVWGTGAKGSKLALAPKVKELSVHAVRGPLTAEFLRRSGIDTSNIKAFFDPGCLIPSLYREEIAACDTGKLKGRVRIIAHYHDDLNWRREYPKHVKDFVSVDTDPAGMIRSILGADRVISSSLHGIIFAEALGIPAVWLAPSSKEDQMKYFDYYYGSGRQQVKCFTRLEDALRADPMPLPKFDFDAYLATFPHAEVADLANQTVGMAVDSTVALGTLEPPERDEVLTAANFDRSDSGGLWLTAKRGLLRTYLRGATPGQRYRIEVLVHPFNPKELAQPQRLMVRANGASAQTADWSAGSRAPVLFELDVEGEEGLTPLDLEFTAESARSPRTLGLSPIGHTLAACVASIKVVSAS